MPTISHPALAELPQPLHLVAALLRRAHYHFGLFSSATDSLDDAQETLARDVAGLVPSRSRVLDVGCGLGGTTRVLAEQGHTAIGIDPCVQVVEHATVAAPEGARFFAVPFESHHDAGGEGFDAIVFVEVLQHLAPLESVLRRAVGLLRPGGTVVVADVVNRTMLPWARVPFHPAGAVAAQGRRHGLDCRASFDLTRQVAATPARFAELLQTSRAMLRRRFEQRRSLGREIFELERQCRLLDEAFRNGDLGYELVALTQWGGA